MEVHEPGHDGGPAGVKARPGPAGAVGHGRHAVHAAAPDRERHVAPDGPAGAVPEAIGDDEEALVPREPGHSMTRSARASTEGGRVSPSAFAVFRLSTSSNLEGLSIGRSAGLAPLRTRST